MIAAAIKRAVDGQHLGRDEMYEVFGQVMRTAAEAAHNLLVVAVGVVPARRALVLGVHGRHPHRIRTSIVTRRSEPRRASNRTNRRSVVASTTSRRKHPCLPGTDHIGPTSTP